MEMDIKCEKCGHVNRAEPESQCSNCGEYLYQFYLKKVRKTRLTKIAIIVSVIAAIVVIGFVIKTTLPIKKAVVLEPVDPVKKDLIDYLKQIKIQKQNIGKTDSAKNYTRNVQGSPNEDDEKVILSKMGLQEIPDYTTQQDKWDEYWDKWLKMGDQIIKSKNIKERFKITKNYYSTEESYFSQITPITTEVESIHKHLIKSKELSRKAYDNFLTGIELGYISNVKEKEDGSIKWSYSTRAKEYSDNFVQFKETSDNEEKTYIRMLEQLVMKHNLLNEYKVAYPTKGRIKERNLKQAEGKK